MKPKISFLFRSFFILAIAMGFGVNSAFAATITVTSPNDEITNDNNCTLREAFEAAETNTAVDACIAGDDNNDFIDLSGITGTIELSKGEFSVKSDFLTIKGPGSDQLTIDGLDNTHRFLDFVGNQQTMYVSGLTLTRFSAVDPNGTWGGAIYTKSNTALYLSDVHFIKNSAFNGGAIYNEGGEVDIKNSFFSGNDAENGGAMMNKGGKVKIQKSTFQDNTAKKIGGAIANNGIFSVEDTTINHNAAGVLGGGIGAETGEFYLSRSTVSNNTSPSAAAIFNYGYFNASNATISGNKADDYVGGFYNDTLGTADFIHTTIADNFANLSGGAADATGAGLYQYLAADKISLFNTIIANNKTGPQSDKADDCFATVTRLGVNLIGHSEGCTGLFAEDIVDVDSMLQPLVVNAPGTTATMALSQTSPAVDASDAFTNNTDQRGVTRPKGTKYDLGAFEFDPAIDVPQQPQDPQQPQQPQQPQGNGIPGGSDISANGSSGSSDSTADNSASGGSGSSSSGDSFSGGGTTQQDTPQNPDSSSGTPADQNTNYLGAGSTPNDHPFTDVSGNFAENEIVKLYNDCGVTGFMDADGKPLGLYRPDLRIKRYDLIVILVKCRFGEQKPLAADAVKPFPDVPTDHYAAPYVARAKQEGIVSGFKDGNFYGNQNTTRSEAAKMIELTWFTQAQVDAAQSQVGLCTDLSSGKDAWDLPYWNFALGNNIMNGYTDKDGKPLKQCGPHNEILRSETAKIVIKTKDMAAITDPVAQ